jgi:hypothetical protein
METKTSVAWISQGLQTFIETKSGKMPDLFLSQIKGSIWHISPKTINQIYKKAFFFKLHENEFCDS